MDIILQSFQNADALMRAAKTAGVPLWIAAAVIQKESSGANVYGNDFTKSEDGTIRLGVYAAGPTGHPTPDPERPRPNLVTEENYRRFEERVLVGGEISNGVGPAQITYPGFIRDANENGIRLWDPYENMLYGFRLIAGYLGGKTTDEAIRFAGTRYNGASAYGDDLLLKAKKWKTELPEENNMARRKPTRTDLNNLVANQKARGFEHYCTPYSNDAGICPSHGGTNPHAADSRHRYKGAVDFGWPGAPISDAERIHVLLEMDRLDADPVIDWRMLFNIADNNHPDHGHVDDGEFIPGFNDDYRDRQNVFAKDGKTVFVSPIAFPNHIPPTNKGGQFTLADGVKAQKAMASVINPKTGKPFYTGRFDGYLGDGSKLSARTLQSFLGLNPDGWPGAGTQAAIAKYLNDLKAPKPPVVKPPAPVVKPLSERVAAYRVAGKDAYATAVLAASTNPPAGKGIIVYRRDTPDAEVALLFAVRAGEGTMPLPARPDGSISSTILAHISRTRPAWIRIIGGSAAIPDSQVSAALTAAQVNH